MPKPLSERLRDAYGGKAIWNALQEAQTRQIHQSIEEANALIKISSPRTCAEMIDSLVKFFFSENEWYFTKDENYAPEIRKMARSILAYIKSLTNMQDIKAIYQQFEKHGWLKEGDFTWLAQEITDSTDEEKTLLSIFRYFHITYTENISWEEQMKSPIVLITFSPTKRFFPEERQLRDLARPQSDVPSLWRLLPKIEEVQNEVQRDTDGVISNSARPRRNRQSTGVTTIRVVRKKRDTVITQAVNSPKEDTTSLESERQWIPVDTSEADAEQERLESNYSYIIREIELLKDFILKEVPFLKELGEYFELQEKKEELISRLSRLRWERLAIEESILRMHNTWAPNPKEVTALSEAQSDLRKQEHDLLVLTTRLNVAENTESLKHTVKNIKTEIGRQKERIRKLELHISRIENPRWAKKKAKKIENKDDVLEIKNLRIAELDILLEEAEKELQWVSTQLERLRLQRTPTLDEFNSLFLQSFSKQAEDSKSETDYLIRPEYARNVILDKLITLIEWETIGTEEIDITEILRIKDVFEHGNDETKREELDKFSQWKCSRYMILLQSWILEKISQEIEITLPEIIEEALPEQNQRKSKNTRDIIPLKNTSITIKKGVKEVRRKKLLDEKSRLEREKRKYIFHYDEREWAIRMELIWLRSLSEKVEDPRLLTIRELEDELQILESNVSKDWSIIIRSNEDEQAETSRGTDENLIKRKNKIIKELRKFRNIALKSKKIIPKELDQNQEEFNSLRAKELEEELKRIRATQKLQWAGVSMSVPEEVIKPWLEVTVNARRKNILRKRLKKLRGSFEAQENSRLSLIRELEDELKLLSVIQDLRWSSFILSDRKEYTELKDDMAVLLSKLRTIR
jgi:hypothetical protein